MSGETHIHELLHPDPSDTSGTGKACRRLLALLGVVLEFAPPGALATLMVLEAAPPDASATLVVLEAALPSPHCSESCSHSPENPVLLLPCILVP